MRHPIASRFALPAFLAVAATVHGLEPVNADLNATAREVLNYLESVYGTKTLAGYNVYVHTPDDYEQTGKQAAIWGRDIRWLGDPAECAAHALLHGYILTLHWHWFFDGQSAWTGERTTPANVGAIVTPGTAEHTRAMSELAAAADKLQVFEDADVPILWRPLHEIDGGWFWWTDKETPENTAALWRMMFDYFVSERGLDNLIWVYSAGEGNKTVAYRRGFYPGAEYVDISGLDIYHVDYETEVDKYRAYWDTMSVVSPGKMLACGEADAIPDPDKMAAGEIPKWLYVLPWWGCPSRNRSVEWAVKTMRHDFVVTLDELPVLGSYNTVPHVGILDPMDDGTAWFAGETPVITAFAEDRGGGIDRVELYAGEQLIGTRSSEPYVFSWTDALRGLYDLTAVAYDNTGRSTRSNAVRTAVGLTDLARGKSVTVSSGEGGDRAVDGDYFSAWSAGKSDDEWIYVDLGAVHTVDRVNLLWGWKIHAADYTIDVATEAPSSGGAWTTVFTKTGEEYVTWEATYRIAFDPVQARYVRMHATRRAGNQTWGGYSLTAFEVPVALASAGRHVPAASTPRPARAARSTVLYDIRGRRLPHAAVVRPGRARPLAVEWRRRDGGAGLVVVRGMSD